MRTDAFSSPGSKTVAGGGAVVGGAVVGGAVVGGAVVGGAVVGGAVVVGAVVGGAVVGGAVVVEGGAVVVVGGAVAMVGAMVVGATVPPIEVSDGRHPVMITTNTAATQAALAAGPPRSRQHQAREALARSAWLGNSSFTPLRRIGSRPPGRTHSCPVLAMKNR